MNEKDLEKLFLELKLLWKLEEAIREETREHFRRPRTKKLLELLEELRK